MCVEACAGSRARRSAPGRVPPGAYWLARGRARPRGSRCCCGPGGVPLRDLRPPQAAVPQRAYLRRSGKGLRSVPLVVEFGGGVEQRNQLIRLQPIAPLPFNELACAPAASDVTCDPAGVLGFVEDHCERAQRLVDRVVRERPQRLSGSTVPEGSAGLSRRADLLVVLVDATAVLLDEQWGDLRRDELAKERDEIADQPPAVVLGRSRADGRIALPVRELFGREFREDRLALRRGVCASLAGTPQPELDL